MEHKSKSFKALNTALPIKRQIDDNLNKLQLQKRKFLALQREEADLKDRVQKLRKQYNDLRYSEFGTKSKNQKAFQNANVIRDVDRNQEQKINTLKLLRNEIDMKRRQVQKYKKLNQKLFQDYDQAQKQLDSLWQKVQKKEEQCEHLKKQLVDYRVLNQKNVTEFQKSHFNLTRSDFKLENSRRKSAVMQTSFWGEQLKNSKALNIDKLSDALKNSGIHTNQGKKDIMTESVPLAKHRVASIIHSNKDKIKISQQYRKFGQGLIELFEIMKNYKGRDDLDWIASQFVAKQRQIQKLQEYVSTLQGNIGLQRKKLKIKEEQDQQLKQVLQTKNQNLIQKHYQEKNDKLIIQIKELQQEQAKRNLWFNEVGQILKPLINETSSNGQIFNRSTAESIIGQIQDLLSKQNKRNKVKNVNESIVSSNKKGYMKNVNDNDDLNNQQGHQNQHSNTSLPSLQVHEIYQRGNNQLLDYGKMKEFAEEFIRNKKYE